MKRLGNLVVFVCVFSFVEFCTCTVLYSKEKSWMEGVENRELDKCSALLDDFARSASNFTHCALKRASPFEFCCRCSYQYSSVLDIKELIYKEDSCVDELVWSEKYQIVPRMFEFATALWLTSHCQDCFETRRNLGEKWKLTNVVIKFFHRLRELKLCLKNNTKTQLIPMTNSTTNGSVSNITSYDSINLTDPHVICKKCESIHDSVKQAYKDVVNDGHDNADINKEDTICADVAAAMNYTRHTWSLQYNCTNPQADLISVVALTCFFALLPLVFYVSIKMNGDSKERRGENLGIPTINYDAE